MEKKSQYHAPALRPVASTGLFDRIISAIKLEAEFKKTKKLFAGMVALFGVSLVSMPFSTVVLAGGWRQSGVGYFIAAAVENLAVFFSAWQDFLLSIFEALPVAQLIFFLLNAALLLFTIRLFLYKRGALLRYMRHTFA